ncbi:unnamed protein product [Amoebophrya sp. A25]|nr:unnamed protein product [Amoebophrya sp. A25]|eukprot:GSA25T00010639001.1
MHHQMQHTVQGARLYGRRAVLTIALAVAPSFAPFWVNAKKQTQSHDVRVSPDEEFGTGQEDCGSTCATGAGSCGCSAKREAAEPRPRRYSFRGPAKQNRGHDSGSDFGVTTTTRASSCTPSSSCISSTSSSRSPSSSSSSSFLRLEEQQSQSCRSCGAASTPKTQPNAPEVEDVADSSQTSTARDEQEGPRPGGHGQENGKTISAAASSVSVEDDAVQKPSEDPAAAVVKKHVAEPVVASSAQDDAQVVKTNTNMAEPVVASSAQDAVTAGMKATPVASEQEDKSQRTEGAVSGDLVPDQVAGDNTLLIPAQQGKVGADGIPQLESPLPISLANGGGRAASPQPQQQRQRAGPQRDNKLDGLRECTRPNMSAYLGNGQMGDLFKQHSDNFRPDNVSADNPIRADTGKRIPTLEEREGEADRRVAVRPQPRVFNVNVSDRETVPACMWFEKDDGKGNRKERVRVGRSDTVGGLWTEMRLQRWFNPEEVEWSEKGPCSRSLSVKNSSGKVTRTRQAGKCEWQKAQRQGYDDTGTYGAGECQYLECQFSEVQP